MNKINFKVCIIILFLKTGKFCSIKTSILNATLFVPIQLSRCFVKNPVTLKGSFSLYFTSRHGSKFPFHCSASLFVCSVCALKPFFECSFPKKRKMLEQKILLWVLRQRELCLTPQENNFRHSLQRGFYISYFQTV